MRLTPAQADSVKRAVADLCKKEITIAMSSELRRFSVIEDIKVSKDRQTLGFEIQDPDTDMRFRRVTE